MTFILPHKTRFDFYFTVQLTNASYIKPTFITPHPRVFIFHILHKKLWLLLFYQVRLKRLSFWHTSSKILFHVRREFNFDFYFTKFPKNQYFYFTKFYKTLFYYVARISKSYFILPHHNEFNFYSSKFNNKLFYFHTQSPIFYFPAQVLNSLTNFWFQLDFSNIVTHWLSSRHIKPPLNKIQTSASSLPFLPSF